MQSIYRESPPSAPFRNRACKTRQRRVRFISLFLSFTFYPSFFFFFFFLHLHRARGAKSFLRRTASRSLEVSRYFPGEVEKFNHRGTVRRSRELALLSPLFSLLNQFRQRQVAAIRSDRTGNVSRTLTQVMEFPWTLFLFLFSVSLSYYFSLFLSSVAGCGTCRSFIRQPSRREASKSWPRLKQCDSRVPPSQRPVNVSRKMQFANADIE